MALIGSSIDPRMFVQDFSGFANAANTQAAGMAQLGQTIGNGIADYSKQKKDLSSKVKSAEMILKAAEMSNPGDKQFFSALRNELSNPGLSPTDAAAMADQVGAAVAMHIGTSRYNTELGHKEREMGMREQQFQQQYGATEMEIARQRKTTEAQTQFEDANAPVILDSVLGALKSNPATASILTPEYVAQLNSMSSPAKFKSAQSLAELLPPKEKEMLIEKFRYQKNGQTMEGPAYVTPSGGARIIPVAGARATMYGYVGDPTPDSNSSVGIGAFVPPAEQAKIKSGGDSVYKLRDNDFALSPDMEQAFRAQGIKPMETVSIQMENGDTVTGRWMDRTAQDDQILAGKVPGVTKPLRGRVDFYTPGGVNPYDGSKIKGVSRVDEITAGAPVGSDMTPTEQIAVAKYADEKTAKDASASSTVAKSEEMLTALSKLEGHPGFNNLFGSNIGVPTWMAGSAGADAKALFNQVEGKGFIEAIQAMKGMGALSNAEGEKASMSYLGLTPSMSEDAAKSRIKELKELVAQGIARTKSGSLVNPDGSPMVPAAQARTTDADRLRSKLGK